MNDAPLPVTLHRETPARPAHVSHLLLCAVALALSACKDSEQGDTPDAGQDVAAEIPPDAAGADVAGDDTSGLPDAQDPPADTQGPPGDLGDPAGDTQDPPGDTQDPPDAMACGPLAAAYVAEAAVISTCTSGAQCEWVTHPVCGSGCAVAVNATLDHTALEAAWQAFSGAGCVPEEIVPGCCDLAPPGWGFGCAEGKCTPCAYQCELNCECAKDASGCDLPECAATSCTSLTAAVDGLVDANAGCSVDADCMRFEHPICGSIGCYQRAISADAPLGALSTAAQAAQDAQCEPFHCGCDPKGEPLCAAGTCRLCPGDPGCPKTCEDLRSELEALAAAESSCDAQPQCTMLTTPFCSTGPGMGCQALAVNAGGIEAAKALLAEYAAKNCPADTCDCLPAEVPICKDKVCTPFYYVN